MELTVQVVVAWLAEGYDLASDEVELAKVSWRGELGEWRGDLLGGALSGTSRSRSRWCGELGRLDSVQVDVLLVAVGLERGYNTNHINFHSTLYSVY